MVTVTPLASFTLPTGTFDGGGTNLVTNANGDLITIRSFINNNTGASSDVIYDLVHTAAGYAAAPLAIGSLSGNLGPTLVTDANGDVFGNVVPTGGTSPAYIFELPHTAAGYGAPITLANLAPGESVSLAIDSAGDLFGASGYNYYSTSAAPRAFELAKTSTGYAATPTTLFTSDSTSASIGGLATDASGNLFLSIHSGVSPYGDSELEFTKTAAGGFATAPTTLFSTTNPTGAYGNLGAISLDAAGDLFVQQAAYSSDAILYLAKSGSGSTGYAAAPSLIDIEAASYGGVSAGDLALIDGNGDLFRVGPSDGTPTSSAVQGPGLLIHVVKANGSYAPATVAGSSDIYSFPAYSYSSPNTNPVGYNPIPGLVADANGVLYGVTNSFGTGGAGAIYQVTGSGYDAAVTPPANTGAPAVSGATTAVAYTFGAPTVTLEPNVALSDTDGLQFDGLVVTFDSRRNDTITASDGGAAVSLATAGAHTVGRFTEMTTVAPNNFYLQFSGPASLTTADYQALLRTLAYSSANDGDLPGTEGVRIVAVDATHAAPAATFTDNGYADASTLITLTRPAATTAPAITGVPATENDPGGAALQPFASATVVDTNAGSTITVQLQSVTVVGSQPQNLGTGGAFAGGGFTVAGGQATFTSTSLAAVQAAVQAVSFTPSAVDARIIYTISDSTGGASVASVDVLTPAAPANIPPVISGAQAGQTDTAGVAIHPFSAVSVTDPDAGQSETVTISFPAANGTLSGGGFTLAGTSGGVSTYSVTAAAGAAGASAAAAQADLRAAVFTPVAGQSSTTGFTLTVSDGQATATDPTTSVVATYTPPPPPASGGGGTVTTTSPSVQDGLTTEFQNLERALPGGADALTPTTPVYAAFQAEKLVAAQLDAGQVTLAQAESQLAHLVDGTTAVAVASYGFFTGSTPTAAGLNYLVHSQANATDLNDAYYARFSTENRYINFAVNLATGPGAGASSFAASYGSLSLADATAKAYAAVFGAPADATKVSALLDTLVPDGLGGQETRAAYFAQYGGDGPNGEGTKAAMVGFLLANAVETGAGVYGAATEHYLSALAHGQGPAFGSELALTYGANVNLVGFTPVPDPTVTG